ncbi:MAG: ABC transporter permease [Bryobacteraceae bacterium]
MPIFFLSGALYPLNDLPKLLSAITSLDPLAYGVDGLRATLIGRRISVWQWTAWSRSRRFCGPSDWELSVFENSG